jgi:NADH-quinone oxidoreductase subunit N
MLLSNLFLLSYTEIAKMSFDWIEPSISRGDMLTFSRDFLNYSAAFLPILFLSTIVISLWCYSSLRDLSLIKSRWVLTLTCIGLLLFYGFSSSFLMNYSIGGTINATNWYVLFANFTIVLFVLLIVWLRNISVNLLLYSGTMLIFSLVLLGSVDLITFYLSFEALSLLTYGIIATNKTVGSSEAALKYFIYGVISSVLLIFGLSLYYISYKTTDWYEMYVYDNILNDSNIFNLVAIILIVLSFSYKMSMFPFHFSLPDVYEGSATWETIAIINLIVKLTLALSLFKVWGYFISQFNITINVSMLLLVLAIASLIIGCFGALIQTSVKRFFAYTSINQAGFIVLGLATDNVMGLQASLVYLVVYMFTLFIFFVGITENSRVIDNILELKDLSFRGKILVAISLFSMAGIPPLMGFISKYWVWVSLINVLNQEIGDLYLYFIGLAFITSIIVSLVSAYYYLRLIKVYVFENTLPMLGNNTKFIVPSGAILISLPIVIILMGGWLAVAENLLNLSWFWAADNYGSWINYLDTGHYVEWLRS